MQHNLPKIRIVFVFGEFVLEFALEPVLHLEPVIC